MTIGITIVVAWAQAQIVKTQQENACQASHTIADLARATSPMFAESSSSGDTTLNITDLRDCSTNASARFVACSTGPATPTPFASTNTGAAMSYGDLEIDVTVTDGSATGTIDSGVFRAGDDGNADGLPDSRADLARINHQFGNWAP